MVFSSPAYFVSSLSCDEDQSRKVALEQHLVSGSSLFPWTSLAVLQCDCVHVSFRFVQLPLSDRMPVHDLFRNSSARLHFDAKPAKHTTWVIRTSFEIRKVNIIIKIVLITNQTEAKHYGLVCFGRKTFHINVIFLSISIPLTACPCIKPCT